MIAVRALQALLALAVVAYAVQGAVNEGASTLWETWVYPGLILAAGAALRRARRARARGPRCAWALLAAGMLLWVAGEAWYSLFLADLDAPPVPSVSDALWLAFYPCCYAALVLLIHRRQERLHLSLWLDGVIGALVVSSVGAALVFRAIVASGEGDTSLIGTDLAYLLGDFALIGLVIAVFALTGWRPGRDLGAARRGPGPVRRWSTASSCGRTRPATRSAAPRPPRSGPPGALLIALRGVHPQRRPAARGARRARARGRAARDDAAGVRAHRARAAGRPRVRAAQPARARPRRRDARRRDRCGWR